MPDFGLATLTVLAAFACNQPVIDAEEIARTPVARRLVRQGFAEDPPGSGVYVKKGASWNWLRRTFQVADKEPVPAACVDRWTATTRIEGNHTVLRLAEGARGAYDDDDPLIVTVNLGYARPREVCVGMPSRRVREALALIGAGERSGPACRRAARAQKGEVRRCYLLPDGTGLVVGIERQRRAPGSKPVEPLVTSLLLGTKKPERQNQVSIFAFRTPIPPAKVRPLCAGWRAYRQRKSGTIRVESCGLEKYLHPVPCGTYHLSILEALWYEGDESHMDRWIVLHDGAKWKVVADLNGLFGGTWVGVQKREFVERIGGGAPEIRLETVIHRDVPMDCLRATEEIRSTVLCGEKGESFCCRRIDTSRRVDIEMAGTVHPMASIYDYGEAKRCRPVLAKHGLSVPDHDRKLLEQKETPLVFLGKDWVLRTDAAGRTTESPLSDLLAGGSCSSPAFCAIHE